MNRIELIYYDLNGISNYLELNSKYSLNGKNIKEFLEKFLERFSIEKLNELKGNYFLVFRINNFIYIFRDLIGIKPIFYHYDNKILNYSDIKLNSKYIELNPRKFIKYDFKSNSLEILERNFKYEQGIKLVDLDKNFNYVKNNIKNLLYNSIINSINEIKNEFKKNEKNRKYKIGLLFSGGTDSTLIALMLKEIGIDFKTYTSSFIDGNIKEGSDPYYAKLISNNLKLNSSIVEIGLNDIINYSKNIMNIIDDSNYTKISVAVPFYASLKKANEDGITHMFIGIGSEEIFGDYKRDENIKILNEFNEKLNFKLDCNDNKKYNMINNKKDSKKIDKNNNNDNNDNKNVKILNYYNKYYNFMNNEINKNYVEDGISKLKKININCLNGLKSLWERDLYRDYALSKHFNIKMILPFLDDELVNYAIKIDPNFKIYYKKDINKIILREILNDYNLSKDFVYRKKVAAQYGSKTDRAFEKLAKKNRVLKQEFLNKLNSNE